MATPAEFTQIVALMRIDPAFATQMIMIDNAPSSVSPAVATYDQQVANILTNEYVPTPPPPVTFGDPGFNPAYTMPDQISPPIYSTIEPAQAVATPFNFYDSNASYFGF